MKTNDLTIFLLNSGDRRGLCMDTDVPWELQNRDILMMMIQMDVSINSNYNISKYNI